MELKQLVIIVRQNELEEGIDAEKRSDAQLDLLVKKLYDEQSVRIISLTKTILDLPNLAIKLQSCCN